MKRKKSKFYDFLQSANFDVVAVNGGEERPRSAHEGGDHIIFGEGFRRRGGCLLGRLRNGSDSHSRWGHTRSKRLLSVRMRDNFTRSCFSISSLNSISITGCEHAIKVLILIRDFPIFPCGVALKMRREFDSTN